MEKVEAEDSVNIIAHMKNGAVGAIEASKTATGTEDELRFELHGSAGAIRFNSMQPHHLQVYDAGISDKPFGGMKGWTLWIADSAIPSRIFRGQSFPLDGCGRMLPAYPVFLLMSQKGSPANRDLIKDCTFNESLNAFRNRPG